jgi:hypothetical protein
MATILDKDLLRESTVKYDDREIQITLTADQRIEFKLKGMKSGLLSISIEDLYKQLKNDKVEVKPTNIKKDNEPVVNLNRLRSMNAIAHIDLKTKVELEKVICELINEEIKL